MVSGRHPAGIRAAISAAADAAVGTHPDGADRGQLTRAAAWWTFAAAVFLTAFGLCYLTWHSWLLGGLSLACALSSLSRCAWKLALLSALGRYRERRPSAFGSAATEPWLDAVDHPDPEESPAGPAMFAPQAKS